MDGIIIIGIGEYAITNNGTKLSTVGLGSCIGTIIYDASTKISGLSHIMLPTMGDKNDRMEKYANTALPAMIRDMIKIGAEQRRMKAKIAGGAHIFSFKDDQLKIGDRNIEAVRKVLNDEKIPMIAEDVGGDRGRTILFNPETCELLIKMVKKGPNYPVEKII